jgi:amino acid permease
MADNKHMSEDEKVLHGMGYAQELSRRMGTFQSFAISFSIICIISGGFGSFPIALATGGPFSLTIGWLIGGAFALVVAASIGRQFSAAASGAGQQLTSTCWAYCSLSQLLTYFFTSSCVICFARQCWVGTCPVGPTPPRSFLWV